jgi:hypothetical protein
LAGPCSYRRSGRALDFQKPLDYQFDTVRKDFASSGHSLMTVQRAEPVGRGGYASVRPGGSRPWSGPRQGPSIRYDDVTDTVTLLVACCGGEHRLLIGPGGVRPVDHDGRPDERSGECRTLAAERLA